MIKDNKLNMPNPIRVIIIFIVLILFWVCEYMSVFHGEYINSLYKEYRWIDVVEEFPNIFFWSMYIILISRLFIWQRIQLGKDGAFIRKQDAYEAVIIFFCIFFCQHSESALSLMHVLIFSILNFYILYYFFKYEMFNRVITLMLFVSIFSLVSGFLIINMLNYSFPRCEEYGKLVCCAIISIFIIIGNRKLQEVQSKSVVEGTKDPSLSPQ